MSILVPARAREFSARADQARVGELCQHPQLKDLETLDSSELGDFSSRLELGSMPLTVVERYRMDVAELLLRPEQARQRIAGSSGILPDQSFTKSWRRRG